MKNIHLEQLRRAEIELVRSWFKPGMEVLEIGGGNGFQAEVLSSWGCKVTSIDIVGAPISRALYYPVSEYDGRNIPFPKDSFDAVFSSNVLEHIPHLSVMLEEISRVIRPDGILVHILPSSSWRFWTSLSHYGHLLRRSLLSMQPVHASNAVTSGTRSKRGRDWSALLKRVLFDGPHGEYPNALYELYAFSRRRWIRVFRDADFEIVKCYVNGLFYTGYGLLPALSLSTRRLMARIFGSAGRVYVMRPGKKPY